MFLKRNLPESESQNLAVTVLYVPSSLESRRGGGTAQSRAPASQLWKRFSFTTSKEGTAENFKGALPDSQGQNLALTVLHEPSSLESGSSDRLVSKSPAFLKLRRGGTAQSRAPASQLWKRFSLTTSKEGTAENFKGALPDSQGRNLALTVLHVPFSLCNCLVCAEFAREREEGRHRPVAGPGQPVVEALLFHNEQRGNSRKL